MNIIKLTSVLFTVTLLAGCAAPKTHYHWANYPSTVYQYYQQSSSPEAQITELKTAIEQSRASHQSVPPGLHAHLGLLYAKTGHTDLAFTEFNTEKQLFPESASYMDFLLSNDKGRSK